MVAISVAATLVLSARLTAVFLGGGLLAMGWYRSNIGSRETGTRLHEVGSLVRVAKRVWFFLVTGPTDVRGVPGLSALNIDPDAAADAYRQRVLAQLEPGADQETVREQFSGACTTTNETLDM